jgi:DNA-binding beta-propeller fold protein YncE
MQPMGEEVDLGEGRVHQLIARDGGVWILSRILNGSGLSFVHGNEVTNWGLFSDESKFTITGVGGETRTAWVASGNNVFRLELTDVEGCQDLSECVESPTPGPHQFIRIPGQAVAAAEGAGFVWVLASAEGSNELIKIDPNTGALVGQPVPVGSVGSGQVAIGAGAVWVTNAVDHTVYQLDPD